MTDEQDLYESTTRWMQELGRRPAVRQSTAAALVQPAALLQPLARKPRRERSVLGVGREVYMFAVMAAAYGNYYFMEVMVEIASLPSVVVFVAHGGPLG